MNNSIYPNPVRPSRPGHLPLNSRHENPLLASDPEEEGPPPKTGRGIPGDDEGKAKSARKYN